SGSAGHGSPLGYSIASMSTQPGWRFDPAPPPASQWETTPPPAEEEEPKLSWLGPKWPREELMAVAGLVILSLILRFHDYTLAPLFSDNFYEVQFVWAGMNLLLHGDPVTFSSFSAYPSFQSFPFMGAITGLVHHWLDQPPLFSSIVGAWALLLG